VDQKLVAQRRAGGVIAAGIDAGARAVLTLAVPGDDEVARRIHRRRRRELVIRGDLVDLELARQRHAGSAVAAGKDAVAAAILTLALPGDHEVARRVHRHRRIALGTGGELVDRQLVTQRLAGGTKTARQNAPAAAVLTHAQ